MESANTSGSASMLAAECPMGDMPNEIMPLSTLAVEVPMDDAPIAMEPLDEFARFPVPVVSGDQLVEHKPLWRRPQEIGVQRVHNGRSVTTRYAEKSSTLTLTRQLSAIRLDTFDSDRMDQSDEKSDTDEDIHHGSQESARPPIYRGAAGAVVADITELLEHILIHLDARSLLLSQRVNHQFKEVISGTRTLQKKLFFQAASAEEAEFFAQAESEQTRAACVYRVHKGTMIKMLNPLLLRKQRGAGAQVVVYGLRKFRAARLMGFAKGKASAMNRDSAKGRKWRRTHSPNPPGSWQRMLLVHGPKIRLAMHQFETPTSKPENRMTRVADGETLGKVVARLSHSYTHELQLSY